MKLSDELKAAGFPKERDVFEELIVKVFHGEFRNWTDEDLLCTPGEAIRFCGLIRQAARATGHIADSVILRALTNLRKNGSVAGRRR